MNHKDQAELQELEEQLPFYYPISTKLFDSVHCKVKSKKAPIRAATTLDPDWGIEKFPQ